MRCWVGGWGRPWECIRNALGKTDQLPFCTIGSVKRELATHQKCYAASVLQHHVFPAHWPGQAGFTIQLIPRRPSRCSAMTKSPSKTASPSFSVLFRPHLHPSDIYTPQGIYFADLPYLQRARFVLSVDRAELRSELQIIGSQSVWANVKKYFKEYVVPGMGLGLEG
jgi:hypothetical protein